MSTFLGFGRDKETGVDRDIKEGLIEIDSASLSLWFIKVLKIIT